MSRVNIVHLYPKEMNIYGDTGNLLVLQKRLAWRGIPFKITKVGIGSNIPYDTHLILGGGGQDKGQLLIEKDLSKKAETLHKLADNGTVMIMICGLYQLFGNRFVTSGEVSIKGIGIFPMETKASSDRMIGNTLFETQWGQVAAFENHSGKTYLEDNSLALGKVIKGCGNNGQDGTEGCRVNNVFGSYGHGPILTKNPILTDELLLLALNLSGSPVDTLMELDDEIELSAQRVAASRPR